jgi:hypothetical protein
MDREALVREYLTVDAPMVKSHENCGPQFAGQYPGGFAPLRNAILEFCPRFIVESGADLDDDGFVRLLEAIQAWQQTTITNFMIELAPETIVLAFVADAPGHAATLSAVALRLQMPLIRLLGADHGTGVAR